MDLHLEKWQAEFVISCFNRGLRAANLGPQPSPWMIHGLEILEKGGVLSAEKMVSINCSGGTDHPDPWF
jgi:hypothetical protein